MTKTTLKMNAVYQANEQMKGTDDYIKYHMQIDSYINNKWVFIGYGVPYENEVATVKKIKNNSYLIVEKENGDKERYTITKEVSELLGLVI